MSGIFWSIIKGLNDGLSNTLTDSTATSSNSESDDYLHDWENRIYNSTDEQIDAYLDRHGLYYSVSDNGRYRCEKVLIDYFVENSIKPYYI